MKVDYRVFLTPLLIMNFKKFWTHLISMTSQFSIDRLSLTYMAKYLPRKFCGIGLRKVEKFFKIQRNKLWNFRNGDRMWVSYCGTKYHPTDRHRISGHAGPNLIVFLYIVQETKQKAVTRLSSHSLGREAWTNSQEGCINMKRRLEIWTSLESKKTDPAFRTGLHFEWKVDQLA